MKSSVLLSIALLAAAFPSIASEQDDEKEVRGLVGRYAQARELRDPLAIESLFTRDADQLVSSGEWRRGRDSLVEGMLGSSRRNPGERTITVETVRFVAEGVAIADARYEIKGVAGAVDRKMWSTFVAVSKEGDWRITAIRNMLPAN